MQHVVKRTRGTLAANMEIAHNHVDLILIFGNTF